MFFTVLLSVLFLPSTASFCLGGDQLQALNRRLLSVSHLNVTALNFWCTMMQFLQSRLHYYEDFDISFESHESKLVHSLSNFRSFWPWIFLCQEVKLSLLVKDDGILSPFCLITFITESPFGSDLMIRLRMTTQNCCLSLFIDDGTFLDDDVRVDVSLSGGFGNYCNPKAIKILLGLYGPSSLIRLWVSIIKLKWDVVGLEYYYLYDLEVFSPLCFEKVWLVLARCGLDLETFILLANFQRRLLLNLTGYACLHTLASIADVSFPLYESTTLLGLVQRSLFPVRIISVQRHISCLETFKTALLRALIGLFRAAPVWSTSVKCEIAYVDHLDPIVDNLGVHHRRTMIFGDLSFYVSCTFVARLSFFMFIVWFEDAIKMDVLNV